MTRASSARLSASIAAAIAAALCLQTGPVLQLCFPIPLFSVLFLYGRIGFSLASGFTVLFSSIAFLVMQTAKGAAFTLSAASSSLLGCALLVLPLIGMLAPGFLRHRYRLVIAGCVSAGIWIITVFVTGSAKDFDLMLTNIAASLSPVLTEGLPQDMAILLGPYVAQDSLYRILRNLVLYSLVIMPTIMYALSWRLGLLVSGFFEKKPSIGFTLRNFYNDTFVMYTLSAGMVGIIVERYVHNEILAVVSWNLLLVSALFLCLQGCGVLLFFMYRGKRRRSGMLLWLAAAILLFLSLYAWPIFALVLLIVGIMEQFVPLRRRFNDKDAVDPTPGRDGDQH